MGNFNNCCAGEQNPDGFEHKESIDKKPMSSMEFDNNN